MSNLNQLSSNVQNLAKQYAAVIEVGKFLASLGSLENLSNELQVQHDAIAGKLAYATLQLSKVEAAVAEQAATHQRNLQTSREQNQQIVDEGKVRAAQIVNEALSNATRIADDADALRRTMDDAKESHKAQIGELDQQIAVRGDELQRVNEAIAAARAKIA